MHRRLDIQGLRAVAVLVVVAFHAGLPCPGGFIGVDVFFVISGFVITGMLHREWATAGRIRFGRFYSRRFKRLTPALAVMVTVTVIVSAVALSPLGVQQTTTKTAAGTILLVANFVIARTTGGYFDAPASTNPLLNTWSLSVEEQFYLAFPAVVAIGWLMARRRRFLQGTPYILVGAIATLSFSLAVITSMGWTPAHAAWLVGYYSPFTRGWEFAVGALLALVLTKVTISSKVLGTMFGLLGAGMVAASLWVITATTPFPGWWALLPVIGTLLVLLAGHQRHNVVSKQLSARPMARIGDWSYSIYLWHWPFIVVAGLLWPREPEVLLAAAVLSFGPALASYRWVETPLRSIQTASRTKFAWIVAVTVSPPLFLALVLGFVAQNGYWSGTVREFQASVMPLHQASLAGCIQSIPLGELPPGACEWNDAAGGSLIYLVGDSTAEQFSESVIRAGQLLARPVVSSTASGCPFLLGPITRGDLAPWWTPSCVSYVLGTASYLRSAPRGTVIISMSDRYWFEDFPGTPLPSGTSKAVREATERTLVTDIEGVVNTLQGAGQKVLLLQPTPKWHGSYPFNPDQCTVLSITRGHCVQEMPRSWAESQQTILRDAITAAATTTGASVLDSWDMLCSDSACSTQGPDFVRYRDDTHISVPQARLLSQAMADAVSAAD